MTDDLLGKVQRIRERNKLNISLKFRRGKAFILSNHTGKVVSPFLSQKDMNTWLDTFELGVNIGRELWRTEMNEIKNLMKEIEEWVVNKKDAIKIVVLLMGKFGIKPQDFLDELNQKFKEENR